jgi:hypothetical protein
MLRRVNEVLEEEPGHRLQVDHPQSLLDMEACHFLSSSKATKLGISILLCVQYPA